MLRGLFVLAILLPGMIFALFDRYRALLLYLWFAFFRPQEWVWFSIAQYRVSLILGLILVVPALATGTFPVLGHPLSIGALALLVCGLLAQTNAVSQAIGWNWIQFFAQLILVCTFAVALLKTPRDLIRAIAVVAGSLGYFATKAGIMSLFVGGAKYISGLAGAFVDNNGYAMGTVMTIPLVVAVGQNAQVAFGGLLPPRIIRWVRYGCFLSAPLCAYTVISTFSRGGFLALVCAIVAFVLLQRRRLKPVLGLIAVALVVVQFVPLPEGYLQRIDSIPVQQVVSADEDEDVASPLEDTAEGRLHFWRVAMLMAEAHPLGVGMRNYELTYNDFDFLNGRYGRRRAVHSSHFQVLAEMGYAGLLVWLGLFVYAFRIGFLVRKRSTTSGLSPDVAHFMFTVSNGLMVSMVGFLIGSCFISLALNDLTWVTFAFLAALDRMSARLCAEAQPTGAGHGLVPRFSAGAAPARTGGRAVAATGLRSGR